MSALQKMEPAEALPDTGGIVGMIERVAMSPGVNIDTLERLLAMQERVQAREAETAFADAMSAAQAELSPVAADANNPQTKSKYASYPALDRAVRPIYVRHGFALSFNTADGAPADYLRVTCEVTHRLGCAKLYHVDMPADGKGAKGGDVMTKTHAVGAAMSYGQRYLLKLIFNMAVGDDVDGNAPPREMSALALAAIAGINGAADLVKLREWRAKNEAGLANFTPAERKEIVALYTRRLEALRPEAKS